MQKAKQARVLESGAISKGQRFEFAQHITAASVRSFAQLSGDLNPLHCDADYAAEMGFRGVVAHGAYQQALVSQAVGMWVIGRSCYIFGMTSRFRAPLVCDATVRVQAEVLSWAEQSAIGQVRVRVVSEDSSQIFSETTVDCGFHKSPPNAEHAPRAKVAAVDTIASNDQDRRVVAVVGATSGILQEVIPELAKQYDLLLIGRNEALLEDTRRRLSAVGTHQCVACDLLEDEKRLDVLLDEALGARPLWGVVHAAAVRPSKEPVLHWHREPFLREIQVSGYACILLARWLARHAGDRGGRVVALGSNYAIHNQPQPDLLRYGIGKSLVSATVAALARELAKDRITVNTVSPDFVPVGMNAGVPDRLVALQQARNPMKRLCSSEDILSSVQFLLSEAAAFISGQEIVLGGGIL